MNEVSADELRTKKEEGYGLADLIGRTGIERQWEAYLRGRDGLDKAPITVPEKAHPLRGEKMDRKASLPTDHGEAIGRRHILTNAPPTILGSP